MMMTIKGRTGRCLRISGLALLVTLIIIGILPYIQHDSLHLGKIQTGLLPQDKLPAGSQTLETSGNNMEHVSTDCASYPQDAQQPLLILATTMSKSRDRSRFQQNVIRNWAMLRPWIQPVLFMDRPSDGNPIEALAKQHNWTVLDVTASRSNLPVFREMILRSLQEYPAAPLVGYANDDILFSFDLIDTLRAVMASVKNVTNKNLFVTGIRRNVHRELIWRLTGVYCPGIVHLLASSLPPFIQDSADYFVFSSASFRQFWGDMPDLVIGRAGYDNWIMSRAETGGAFNVECSRTVTAAHQTGADGNRSGEFKPGPRNITDQRLNRDLIPEHVYKHGYHFCISRETVYSTNSDCKKRKESMSQSMNECIIQKERKVTRDQCSKINKI